MAREVIKSVADRLSQKRYEEISAVAEMDILSTDDMRELVNGYLALNVRVSQAALRESRPGIGGNGGAGPNYGLYPFGGDEQKADFLRLARSIPV